MKVQNIHLLKNISAKSKAGINNKGEKKTNQDSFISRLSILGLDEFHLFGVLDGHGTINIKQVSLDILFQNMLKIS